MAYINRRQFLSRSSALGFASGIGALAGMSALRASAADTSGYKALVCVFLKGGMDHADSVIHYDQSSWTALRNLRGDMFSAYNADDPTSTRNRASLLKLDPDNASVLGGREFSLPPELAPLHSIFNNGDMAIVGNVGPLLEHVTRQQIENDTANLPPRIGSHNDGQSFWMSLGVEGTKVGWGGRFADAAIASSPGQDPTFVAISTGSNEPFLAGHTARPFRATGSGGLEPEVVSRRILLSNNSADNAVRDRLVQYLERSDYGESNYYVQDFNAAKSRAILNSRSMLAAREGGTPLATVFPSNNLGRQLQLVAETIRVQQTLNTSRQVFFVTTGGYDTHSGQVTRMAALHTQLAGAFSAFRDAMVEINHWNDTTLFTASDFGRSMIDNGDGTDHGWAGHHFVLGGAVQGKRIYGELPGPDIGSDSYSERRGRMIPSIAIEQYAATLGTWFGLTDSEVAAALPNLSRFNQANLGFMQTA